MEGLTIKWIIKASELLNVLGYNIVLIEGTEVYAYNEFDTFDPNQIVLIGRDITSIVAIDMQHIEMPKYETMNVEQQYASIIQKIMALPLRKMRFHRNTIWRSFNTK